MDDVAGSPPRVRGKVFFYVAAIHGFGITPACAGKRQIWDCQKGVKKDHPRVCGEKKKQGHA